MQTHSLLLIGLDWFLGDQSISDEDFMAKLTAYCEDQDHIALFQEALIDGDDDTLNLYLHNASLLSGTKAATTLHHHMPSHKQVAALYHAHSKHLLSYAVLALVHQRIDLFTRIATTFEQDNEMFWKLRFSKRQMFGITPFTALAKLGPRLCQHLVSLIDEPLATLFQKAVGEANAELTPKAHEQAQLSQLLIHYRLIDVVLLLVAGDETRHSATFTDFLHKGLLHSKLALSRGDQLSPGAIQQLKTEVPAPYLNEYREVTQQKQNILEAACDFQCETAITLLAPQMQITANDVQTMYTPHLPKETNSKAHQILEHATPTWQKKQAALRQLANKKANRFIGITLTVAFLLGAIPGFIYSIYLMFNGKSYKQRLKHKYDRSEQPIYESKQSGVAGAIVSSLLATHPQLASVGAKESHDTEKKKAKDKSTPKAAEPLASLSAERISSVSLSS